MQYIYTKMPKEKKNKVMSTKIGQSTKHAPLGQVIQDDINRNKYVTGKISGMAFSRRMNDNSDEGGMEGEGMEEEMLDEKTSRKIIDMGIEQQREVMEEDAAMQRVVVDNDDVSSSKKKKSNRLKNDDSSSDEDDSDDDNNEKEDEEELVVEHDNSGYVNISSTNIGLTPEEEALLSNMMGNTSKSSNGMGEEEEPQRRNLADIIMAKIEEKEALVHANKQKQYGDNVNVEEIEEIGIDLPPKVVQVSNLSFCILCMCVFCCICLQSHTIYPLLYSQHVISIYNNTGLY